MRNLSSLILTSFALALPLLVAPSARAQDLSSCGNINVEANAQCKVEVEGGCVAKCTPIQCSAALYAKCSGTCMGTVQATCTTSCQAACKADCDIDPPKYDCSAKCEGSCGLDCSANCDGKCATSANTAECKGQCQASCNATCEGECSASCKGTQPSATCDAKCQASCTGECKAEANIDCQGTCQSMGYAMCTGGCKTRCMEPDGALFCDGQYVDHGGNLDKCIAALDALLTIDVDASARGSAECSGNQCNAEGEAACSCAAPGTSTVFANSAALFGIGALGMGIALRRRARQQY